MNNSIRSIAERFTVYSQLGWFGRWEFRRVLRWVSSDAVSLELLLDFEKKLEEKSLFSWQIYGIILNALSWYNREDHDDRLQNRIQPTRLPEMLQIITIFLEKSHKLNPGYRELILNIINTGDNFGKQDEADSGVTPEQFRLEAAKAISSPSQYWGDWLPHVQNNMQRDADRTLGYLEKIAHKASDLQQFTVICRKMAPVIGFQATSSLLEMSKDFHEFEIYFHRINAQIELSRDFTGDMFLTSKTISELHQSLAFLEAITKDARRMEYVRYVPTNNTAWKSYDSFVVRMVDSRREYVRLDPTDDQGWKNSYTFAGIVRSAYIQQVWKKTSEYDTIIEDLCHKFEENVVAKYLNNTWDNLFASTRSRYSPTYKIRWEFDKFTTYIPYEERTQDWTQDGRRSRRYWNWRETEKKEHRRFMDTFTPKLRLLFGTFTLSDIEILFHLFPSYLTAQEFKKKVYIPVAWNRSVETLEGYDKGVGFYEREVVVAWPTEFIAHTFTFERPYLQEAVNLIGNVAKVREAIQAHKNSSH